MTTFPQLLGDLSSRRIPVLTVYSHERVELSGPVVARWLAKIANLIGEELGADLFGSTSPLGESRPRLYAPLVLWQRVLWELSARFMGWEILDAAGTGPASDKLASDNAAAARIGPRVLPGDVVVSNAADTMTAHARGIGAWVLLQSPSYLAFSWDGDDLDEGELDALQELMAQPDALATPVPSYAPPVEDAVTEALRGQTVFDGPLERGTRIGLLGRPRRLAGEVCDQWLRGCSVVVIDPTCYSPAQADKILSSENVSAGLGTYR
ncbi:hypothetical protein [Schaalia sp. ZJ1691]|uniref:hypothetical protein n=1 Tax=Schaalia sp. ZJ1691 TaxID=2709404 RepID=UPI0013ED888F|nr:hypothetical protein [Schaalia sp. ZJ1691]